jgi:hypothetical protein
MTNAKKENVPEDTNVYVITFLLAGGATRRLALNASDYKDTSNELLSLAEPALVFSSSGESRIYHIYKRHIISTVVEYMPPSLVKDPLVKLVQYT